MSPAGLSIARTMYGKKPDEWLNNWGYGYAGDNEEGGFDLGAGVYHGSEEWNGITTVLDGLYGNANVGAWRDGDDWRKGIRGEASVLKGSIKGEHGGVDYCGPTANAEASLGSDGATLGVGANVASFAATFGGDGDYSSTRFGLSAGPGAAGRLHWGDKNKDGFREYGFGADVGPVTFDFKTSDPLRSLITAGGFNPLGDLATDALGMGKDNLTEDAANMFGLSIKNADLGTTADALGDLGSRAVDKVAGWGSDIADWWGNSGVKPSDIGGPLTASPEAVGGLSGLLGGLDPSVAGGPLGLSDGS